MTIDVTRVDLGYLLKPYLTHTLPLLIPKLTFWIGLYYTLYWFNLGKVSNGAKIRNRYNQVPHLTQDTNGKVTNSQKTPQTRAKRSALSQQVTTKHI